MGSVLVVVSTESLPDQRLRGLGAGGEWRAAVAMGAFAFVVGAFLRPAVLVDDAAITFRYAARAASGLGLTYNDHERVMGYSNPLYTLVLTLLHKAGIPFEAAAVGLGLIALAVTAGLVCLLASRLSTLWGGVIAVVILIFETWYVSLALSGMESGLAACLGLAAVLAASDRREVLAGALLGLALWNKLDAGLLCLALAGAWVVVERRVPWRMATATVAVVSPWLVFAWLYYGSPVPHSVIFKLGDDHPPFSHAWVFSQFADHLAVEVLAAALFAVLAFRSLDASGRLVVLALSGWFVFHAGALSLIDLGDQYSWYLTVLFPVVAVLAGSAVGRTLALIGSSPHLAAGIAVALAAVMVVSDADLLLVGGLVILALLAGRRSLGRPTHRIAFPVVLAGTLMLVVVGRLLAPGLLPLDLSQTGALSVIVIAGILVGGACWLTPRHPASAAALGLVAAMFMARWAFDVAGDLAESFRADDVQVVEGLTDTLAEGDRRAAGRFIGSLARDGEVVSTCYGWIAYGALDNPVNDTCGDGLERLNQVDPPPGDPVWFVLGPVQAPVASPDGFRLAAHFTAGCTNGTADVWYSVLVREGTSADRRAPQPEGIPQGCIDSSL